MTTRSRKVSRTVWLIKELFALPALLAGCRRRAAGSEIHLAHCLAFGCLTHSSAEIAFTRLVARCGFTALQRIRWCLVSCMPVDPHHADSADITICGHHLPACLPVNAADAWLHTRSCATLAGKNTVTTPMLISIHGVVDYVRYLPFVHYICSLFVDVVLGSIAASPIWIPA